MSIRQPTGPGTEEPSGDTGSQPDTAPGTPPGTRPAAWRSPLLALVGVVVVAIAVILFAALRDEPETRPTGAGPVGTPGATSAAGTAPAGPAPAGAPPGASGAPSGAGTRAPSTGTAPGTAAGDHVATGRVGGITTASLDLVSGVSALTMQAAPLGDDLYRVQTPADSALKPVVENKPAGRVSVRFVPTGRRGPGATTIVINSAVTWSVRLGGSAEREILDLGGARLTALELAGGSGDITVTLPRPSGTMLLTMSGGAGQLRLHVPRDVPTRVRIGTGAGQVTVDGATRQSVQPGTTIAAPDWDRAQNRLDVNATAGVAGLTVDRV